MYPKSQLPDHLRVQYLVVLSETVITFTILKNFEQTLRKTDISKFKRWSRLKGLPSTKLKPLHILAEPSNVIPINRPITLMRQKRMCFTDYAPHVYEI